MGTWRVEIDVIEISLRWLLSVVYRLMVSESERRFVMNGAWWRVIIPSSIICRHD